MTRNDITCPSARRLVKASRGAAPVSGAWFDAPWRIGYASAVDRALRMLNALVALATLASALAVLASDLLVPGYRAHYRDALWFVAAYAALQAFMLVQFVRGGRLVPGLVLAKTAAAYAFLAAFLVVWPQWRYWTPGRYVYELFAWGDGSAVGLFALVFLGRGAFNTVNAVYFWRSGLLRLRARRPLLGRVVTVLPIGVTVLCVWTFLGLVQQEQRTFSADARDIAREIVAGLDCEAVRARTGQTTTDLRRRGERSYQVEIVWGCPQTRVTVHAEDGRLGTASEARAECCAVTPPAARPPTPPAV